MSRPKTNTRSLGPTSTPAHEARAGDPGSRAEESARSLNGRRDDYVFGYIFPPIIGSY